MLDEILKPVKTTARSLLFAATLAAASILGCEDNGGGGGNSDSDGGPTYTQEETIQNQQMHEGVNFTSWWYDDYLKTYTTDSVLEELHTQGVESVSVLTTWYQDSSFPTEVYPLMYKTPMDAGIEHVIQKAKSLGMRTVLKPHIDPDDWTWRGYITFDNEPDWAQWFANYTDFILYHADLAERNEVDVLVVGTELAGTTHRDEWRQVIDDVRAVYSGEIVYAAAHDNYQSITWWDKPDYIGITAYFPLTGSFDPTMSELQDAWTTIAQELEDFSQLHNKKIIISEVGYQSYDGANMTPWWASTSTPDEQEQADCCDAMFNSLFNQDFIAGIYIWMCYYSPGQDVNGFDFLFKESEDVVNYFYHLEDQ